MLVYLRLNRGDLDYGQKDISDMVVWIGSGSDKISNWIEDRAFFVDNEDSVIDTVISDEDERLLEHIKKRICNQYETKWLNDRCLANW